MLISKCKSIKIQRLNNIYSFLFAKDIVPAKLVKLDFLK